VARVLITGCSSGIGRATALHLTNAGHEVIATARNPSSLADLAVSARLRLDVTDDDSVANAVAEAGRIDVLINNAGFSVWAPAELCPVAKATQLVQTNLLGVMRMTQAVLPQMRQRRSGRIIQISSTSARRPSPLLSHYAATKAAVETFSLALRAEVREFGIWVSVVGMGAVQSNIGENRFTVATDDTDYAVVMARVRRRNQRLMSTPAPAQEVAATIQAVMEADEPEYRVYVGEAMRRTVAELAALSDAEFERRMLIELGFADAGK